MDNNNEQENGSDVDGGDLFDRIYLGQPLDNIPDVPFRLIIDASVTMIDEEACYDCTTLIEVVFHNNVTEIGYAAFAGCHNLERVELLEGLLRVEHNAFVGCNSLPGEIVIPASVQYMGDGVFLGCTSLESVVFVQTPNMVELGRSMFFRCTNLRFVTLPHNLHLIPAYFFEDCISLTHLQLPESVEEIGEKAFNGSGLQSVTISKNVRQIRWAAFGYCAFLEKVTFHSSTNLIMDNDIFANCSSLSVIKMYPWLWPKLFVSMKGQPDFLFKFFREYHTKIFDFETPDVRLVRRLRRDRKRTATMIDDTI